jgi:hypothetical protein
MNCRFEKVQAIRIQIRRRASALAMAESIAACGSSDFSTEYIGQPVSLVDKLVFDPGNKVRAVGDSDIAAGVYCMCG